MFEPSGAPIAFPRVRESGAASPSLTRLKPLLEIANLVRDERELEDVLESIAETISSGLGWRTVVDRHGASVVRHGELDRRRLELPTFVPSGAATQDPEGWDPEDSLIVPLAYAGRGLLGILSIDEPIAGRMPADEDLNFVVAMAAQGANAIEQLQRHRRHVVTAQRSNSCTRSRSG